MPNQATTAEDLNSLTAATEAQASQEPNQVGEATASEPTAIPEKFVGKSAIEVIEAYNNLERHNSKVSSERAEERKKREELEERIRQLETRPATQPQYVQQVEQPKAETDPFSDYEEAFDSNPREGIKDLVAKTAAQLRREFQQQKIDEERIAAASYHMKQKQENPLYAKLEPTMVQLANKHQNLVRSDKLNSVQALELLYLAAKGAQAEELASEAASRAKKEQQVVKEEKRSAFSESTASKGDSKVAFNDLSLADMEKALGFDYKNRG